MPVFGTPAWRGARPPGGRRPPRFRLEAEAEAALRRKRKPRNVPFDLLLSDLGLPDGDGRELIGELRRASPGTSVLVLSATIEPEHLDDLRTAGAEAVLAKVESPPLIAEEERRLAGG